MVQMVDVIFIDNFMMRIEVVVVVVVVNCLKDCFTCFISMNSRSTNMWERIM